MKDLKVKTRFYFTTISHLKSLVKLVRTGGFFTEDDLEVFKLLDQINDVSYLAHIVFLLYEDEWVIGDDRFRIELQISPGYDKENPNKIFPRQTLTKDLKLTKFQNTLVRLQMLLSE